MRPTRQADKLDWLLGAVPLVIGDLILADVLKGCSTDREFNDVKQTLGTLELITLGGLDVAVQAAKNFRTLPALGFTVRKTIYTVIATRCIMDHPQLLQCDCDFDSFAEHLGLRCVPCAA